MRELGRGSGFERLRAIARRRLGVGSTVFCWTTAAVAGLVVGLPDLFRATATVLVERPSAPDGMPGEVEARLHQIGQAVLSRSRVLDLVGSFGLYPQLRGRASEDALIERMRRDVMVELKGADSPILGRSTTAFTVSYRGPDPEVAAAVANAVASQYVDADRKTLVATADDLKEKLEEAKRRLDEEERRLAVFQDRHWGELPQQAEANRAAIDRLSSQIRGVTDARRRATERRADLLREIEAAEEKPPSDAPGRLAKLRQDLADLKRRFTDRHPDVRRAEAEIAALERATQDAARAEPDGKPAGHSPVQRLKDELRQVEEEIRTLQGEEETYRRESEAYEQRLENAPRRARGFEQASRDYQTTKTLYEGLLRRYEEAQLTAGTREAGPGRFRLLELALPPREPAAPHRPRLMAVGLILAFGLAIGVAALVEQSDTTFHAVDEVRGFTRVPVLASLPAIAAGGRRRWRRALVTALVIALLGGIGRASFRFAHGNEDLVALFVRGRAS